jgi:uncharacterized protein (TIGR02246 family)
MHDSAIQRTFTGLPTPPFSHLRPAWIVMLLMVLAHASQSVLPARAEQTTTSRVVVAAPGESHAATAGAATGGIDADQVAVETAVKSAAAATVEAFNAGDAARIAGLFADEGELIDEDGNVFAGRDEVGGLFREFFGKFPGSLLDMEVTEARPLGDNLAVEEGIRRITTPDGTAAQMVYTAIRKRQGDTWPIVSYREYADDPLPTPQEMLAAIDWLVGEWVDESPEARTSIRYDWSEDANFLVGQYTLAIDGRPAGKTTQRIGWDPVVGTLRSWTFDPDGGFSEGVWLPTDDGWVIRSEATMPDGATGVATVTLRIRDADHFSVESSDRIVGGIEEPDFSLVIARKPPAPATSPQPETAAPGLQD